MTTIDSKSLSSSSPSKAHQYSSSKMTTLPVSLRSILMLGIAALLFVGVSLRKVHHSQLLQIINVGGVKRQAIESPGRYYIPAARNYDDDSEKYEDDDKWLTKIELARLKRLGLHPPRPVPKQQQWQRPGGGAKQQHSAMAKMGSSNGKLKGSKTPIAQPFQPKMITSNNKDSISLEQFLPEFRLCRITPAPIFGKPPVDIPHLSVLVNYQCGGSRYSRFANLLEEVIRNKAQDGYQWGKQDTILPKLQETYEASTNVKKRAILIMGNSHTRQLAGALLCQYGEQIVDLKTLYTVPKYPANGIFQFTMQYGLTVYVAANIPFVYSHSWVSNLETIMDRKLSSMDAIVMGRFNSYSDSTGTKFHQMMLRYESQFPEFKIDFEHIAAPEFNNVTDHYAGPMVYVSMFAKYGVQRYKEAKQHLHQLATSKERTNLKVVHGRRYIGDMYELIESKTGGLEVYGPLHECSTDESHKVATCITNSSGFRFSNGHRCMGNRGGHPDLVAWDVVTALHKLVAVPEIEIKPKLPEIKPKLPSIPKPDPNYVPAIPKPDPNYRPPLRLSSSEPNNNLIPNNLIPQLDLPLSMVEDNTKYTAAGSTGSKGGGLIVRFCFQFAFFDDPKTPKISRITRNDWEGVACQTQSYLTQLINNQQQEGEGEEGSTTIKNKRRVKITDIDWATTGYLAAQMNFTAQITETKLNGKTQELDPEMLVRAMKGLSNKDTQNFITKWIWTAPPKNSNFFMNAQRLWFEGRKQSPVEGLMEEAVCPDEAAASSE